MQAGGNWQTQAETREFPRSWQGVQVGRGLAALMVVAYHAALMLADPRYMGAQVAGGLLRNFNAGVDFFFVLSGFIISWVHWDDIGRPKRIPRFLFKRAARIYPPYWVILLPLILAYQLHPQGGEPSQHEAGNVLASIVLAPYPVHPVLGAAWTLVYEMLFYLLFALVIRLGRRGLWLFAGWAAAIVAANLRWKVLPFPASILLDAINLEFLMGIIAARVLRRVPIPWPGLLLALGCAGFLGGVLAGNLFAVPLLARLLLGGCAAMGIVGLCRCEQRYGWHFGRLPVLLGAASYSVYLTHGTTLSLLAHALARLRGAVAPDAALAGLVLAGALAGIAYWRMVEQPLLRRVNRFTPL